MTERVETWFLEPLEKHYETKPKVGARTTILQELARYTETTLGKAQNWLKVNRKAQTFPSPAECIAACKQFEVLAIAGQQDVEGGTYAQRISAFAAARPKTAVYPSFDDETPEFRAWHRYWVAKNERNMISMTAGIAAKKKWTFPTRWPWEFDLGYVAGDDPEARDD